MKIFQFVLASIINVLFTSADPNLFGSRKRRKKKEKLANEFKAMAKETQGEIDILKSQNPFESASAKSAMATSARRSKQLQTRFGNMLGGNASAESLVAAQGATQEAVAGTAGDIAVGSEALKAQKIAGLRGQKSGQMGNYGQTMQSSIDEYGSGWNSFFNTLLPGVMSISEGVGGAISGAGEGGGGAAAAAALSDVSTKENINLIGELQGRKIYKYNFIGDPSVHIGVLSHEIKEVNPDMVIKDGDVYKVYYDKVFKTVD